MSDWWSADPVAEAPTQSRNAGAISSIESGGNYRAIGPVTRTGARALGKYQVLASNVGPWTEEILGRRMTPREFLMDDDAQDKVFEGKFGEYVQKHGEEGASRAWFAGEGGMNDPNRKDILGTSVADYSRKFTGALGYADEGPTRTAQRAAPQVEWWKADPVAKQEQPQPDQSFEGRFVGESPNPPGNPEALSKGLRTSADKRLVESVYGPGASEKEKGFDTFIAEWANTMFLNVPRNVGAFYLSKKFDVPFNEAYERLKNAEEARSRLHPEASAGGTAAGVVNAIPALPAWAGGAALSTRAGKTAVTAGGYAGASELFDSKDPVQASVAAGLGAALGLVATPVAEKIIGFVANRVRSGKTATAILKPDGSLTDEAIAAAREAGIEPEDLRRVLAGTLVAQNKGVSQPAVREAQLAEFNIPGSRGQVTGDISQQQFEQAAARGGYGAGPQRTVNELFEQQQRAVGQAKQGIQENVAATRPMVATPQEAAEVVQTGARSRAGQAKAGVNKAYDEAYGQEGELSSVALDNLGLRVRTKLASSETPVIVDEVLTPAASRATKILDEAAPSVTEAGVDLRVVEQTRKKLIAVGRSANTSEDRRAVRQVISAFDNEIERAIDDGLFSGSDKALEAFKAARAKFSEYRGTFKSQGAGDDVGKAMERIVERDATPAEIASLLYGKSVVGERGVSVRLAQRMKEVFGETSEEWSAIRQGLLLRLTSKPEGVTDFGTQALSQRISNFVNGDGKALADRVFLPEEISTLKRLANAMKILTANPNATNPSGSAGTLWSIARQAASGQNVGTAVLAALGYQYGGPEVAGTVVAARIGKGLAGHVRDTRRATAATRGAPELPRQTGPNLGVPFGIGTGEAYGQ